MTTHRAIGRTGVVYEVRGTLLFIDGREASRTDGEPWGSVDDAKSAAGSAEISVTHGGLSRASWRVVEGGVVDREPAVAPPLVLREAVALLASLCADRNDVDAWERARAFCAAYAREAVR